MKRTLTALALASALAGAAACTPTETTTPSGPTAPGNTSTANANANTAAIDPSKFAPGTAEYVLTHQPDYQADVTVKTGALTYTGKVGKSGENWRFETAIPVIGNSVTFVRAGQPVVVVLPEKKQYIEYPASQDGADLNPIASTIKGLAQQGITFEKIGNEVVDGQPTTKWRGTKAGETGEMIVYSADNLKGLIVRIDGKKENVIFNATWSNVQLDPPAASVAPPADLATAYKKMDLGEYQAQFSSGAPDAAAPTAPTNTNTR